MLEERPRIVGGNVIPIDLTQPNPNGEEFDNLYIDMNGIIHPCSHPEDAPAPETEEMMYLNVMRYVDRLVAAVRPRRLLFMAIDGTAPRAKMNQQRARRFKAAQEAKERAEVMKEVREELKAMGHPLPPEKGPEWDSNVITPGTGFMARLAEYLRFYVQDRMNRNKYWRSIKVILSDANEPGEGEHKIMAFVRRQRAQPGFDPNQHHVLHGLDADLIMLGLATHEARFTILREQVTFGRRDEETKRMAREAAAVAHDALTGANCSGDWPDIPEDAWLTSKPLQRLEIWVLREYLRAEFQCLEGRLPFGYDFERVVDDFVFMCFFVGNDFLPHLPSLDIRDGAIDFLFNVYKRVILTMGGYLTNPGGEVNLGNVDVILSEVGLIEDEVFRRRKEAEERDNIRQEQFKAQKKAGGNDRIGADAARAFATPVGKGKQSGPPHQQPQVLTLSDGTKIPQGKGLGMDDIRNKAAKHLFLESIEQEKDTLINSAKKNVEAAAMLKNMLFSEDGDKDDDDSFLGTQLAEAQLAIKEKVKERSEKQLEDYRKNVNDTVRLWEKGWKDRYYADKYKEEDIAQGGGREKVFQSYVEGLCWVLRYYYRGCASWKWFYQFHYSPFASDLVNVGKYEFEFQESKPFKPIHQLMAVLPPASSKALPEPCHWLMCEKSSPIIDFYPEDVPCDPNGKAMPWLWVVLLPFIDEKRLLDALLPCEAQFTPEETKRNSYGPGYLFVHDSHPGIHHLFACYESDEKKELDSSKFESLAGFIKKATEPAMAIATNEKITAPKRPPGAFQDIERNHVVCVEYSLPPDNGHLCRMLSGARVPPSRLEAVDLLPRRPPRLSRGGMTIADLGVVRGVADRMVRGALGMGGRGGQGGGRGGQQGLLGNQPFAQAQTQQGHYYQQQQAGWATLEPHNMKRFRQDQDAQNQRMCKFFQQGHCNKGTNCQFSHGDQNNHYQQNNIPLHMQGAMYGNQQFQSQNYGYNQQQQQQQDYTGFNYSQSYGYTPNIAHQNTGRGRGQQGYGGQGRMQNNSLRNQLGNSQHFQSNQGRQQGYHQGNNFYGSR